MQCESLSKNVERYAFTYQWFCENCDCENSNLNGIKKWIYFALTFGGWQKRSMPKMESHWISTENDVDGATRLGPNAPMPLLARFDNNDYRHQYYYHHYHHHQQQRHSCCTSCKSWLKVQILLKLFWNPRKHAFSMTSLQLTWREISKWTFDLKIWVGTIQYKSNLGKISMKGFANIFFRLPVPLCNERSNQHQGIGDCSWGKILHLWATAPPSHWVPYDKTNLEQRTTNGSPWHRLDSIREKDRPSGKLTPNSVLQFATHFRTFCCLKEKRGFRGN